MSGAKFWKALAGVGKTILGVAGGTDRLQELLHDIASDLRALRDEVRGRLTVPLQELVRELDQLLQVEEIPASLHAKLQAWRDKLARLVPGVS